MSDREKILDAVAPLKRGKWVSAALRPWTGDVAAAKFEELRSAVEDRGNSAADDAAIAGYEAGCAAGRAEAAKFIEDSDWYRTWHDQPGNLADAIRALHLGGE